MEVRIKQGKEMIDATIEMVDGIMVVSPVVKFEPKDGDVIYCKNSACSYVAIFRNIAKGGKAFFHYAIFIDSEKLRINTKEFDFSDYSNPRPATEEEKQKLFDKLAEEGYSWNSEKKELVKLKWKPKEGECYYRPQFKQDMFQTCKDVFTGLHYENIYCDKGWVFKTEQECQELCDRLNDPITK